ncbi:hypothetical protein [Glycomyces sp. NRRL B-16210]|uniref:hypothetical protein n=1 Tax=Glycomyces sp. NRRL B-16210 TaxID=1463821 RepID=UPI000AE1C675|nr:hypothetical protein [Glycomyces sp. NRRL B-16210]
MPVPRTTGPDNRARMGAVGFAIAGVLFVLYEAAAPRADQTTLEGAESWTSAGWAVAHIAAIVGLILIPLGYGALRGVIEKHGLEGTRNEKTAFLAAVIGYIGSGLTISYYGAEVYGLKAIGARAVADGDASLTEVGEAFRFDATAMAVFAIGLALIAVAAVLAAVAVWRSGTLQRWSAVPFAALMVTFLPQFFLPHAGRIAWGALVTAAALWIAAELWRAASKPGPGELQEA